MSAQHHCDERETATSFIEGNSMHGQGLHEWQCGDDDDDDDDDFGRFGSKKGDFYVH
jgi:hypothetical protein